jgi:outer membrane protein TolC
MRNIYIKSLLLALCAILPINLIAQVQLDSCQAQALENYPLIAQYDLIAESREYSLANANKSYLPQLDVTLIGGVIEGLPTITLPGQPEATGGVDFQFISMMQLNQVIWDGGITKARKKIIEASSEIEKAELEVSLYALEDRVNNLFFGILLIDEQIAQLELLKSTLERNKKRVEVAVENGTAFNSDVDEIKVEVIKANQNIDELRFNRMAFLQMLSLMTGKSLDHEAKFIRPQAIDNHTALQVNRPELNLLNNRLTLLQEQGKIQKAALYPKLGIMGFATFIQPGVEFGTSEIENVLVAGLSLNWNIGELYRNGNNKKLTEVNINKLRNQRETFLFNTNLGLSQVGNDLQKLSSLIEQDKEILSLKSSIRKSYDVKYTNGVSTMSALLDKVNDENMANQQLIMHEIQYLKKLYEYKNQSGN